ncbi:GntR family transcriptional regulator [Intrasporangium chromatireducens Q5-1]|uniref:GntR family transcriptional regulator n=1 Tax=Intrasporangium chromatireducens Q5-1 TaxID=584657 RepID=W9GF70_9MICO|nr:GntR family transcriptional regulator [Intrasporangium chromatireducens]EWT03867.1 GntR family transcriptional regulator [Intrasporangium chromatireducens Q5-1]
MNETGARLPKYHRIADALREQIRTGRLAPGDRLPAETAIAATHHTSVPTVRQAMSVLRAEGLIESRHGIGTFVRATHRLQRRSRNRYGEARGRDGLLTNTLRHEIASVGIEPAPEQIADCLNVEAGTEVVARHRRLYDEEDRLTEIGASYLPKDIAAGTYLEEPTVVPKALFRCVEDLTGRRYTDARDQVTARRATDAEADRFGLPLGAYVLHLIHTATDENGDVLEVSESIWPADNVIFVDHYPIPAGPTGETGSEI